MHVSFHRTKWRYLRRVPPRYWHVFREPGAKPDAPVNLFAKLEGVPRANTKEAKADAIVASAPLRKRHDELFAHLDTLSDAEVAALNITELREQATRGAVLARGQRERSLAEYRTAYETIKSSGKGELLFEMFRLMGLSDAPTFPEYLEKRKESEERVQMRVQNGRAAQQTLERIDPDHADKFGVMRITEFWTDKKSGNHRAKTLRDATRALSNFNTFLAAKGVFDYRKVTRKHALEWAHDLSKQKNAKGKLRSYDDQHAQIGHVAAFFSVATDHGKIDLNPFTRVRVFVEEPTRRPADTKFMNLEQRLAILKAVEELKWGWRTGTNGHEQVLWCVKLCAYTAARQGEIAQLSKSDVIRTDGDGTPNPDGEHVVLRIRTTDDDGKRVKRKSVKNSVSVRRVALNSKIALDFWRYVQECRTAQLFPSLPHSDEGEWGRFFTREFYRVREAAQLPKRFTFRHLRSTGMAILKANPAIHAEWRHAFCGHSDGEGTSIEDEHYAHIPNSILQDVADALNPFDK